jgi:hypothetical protein
MNRQQGRWREGIVGRKWRDRLGDRWFTAGETTSDHSHDERSSNGEARQTRRRCGFPATACEACKYGSIDLGQSLGTGNCAGGKAPDQNRARAISLWLEPLYAAAGAIPQEKAFRIFQGMPPQHAYSPMTRRPKEIFMRFPRFALAFTALGLVAPQIAAAHTQLVSSSPAANATVAGPAKIELRFNEPVIGATARHDCNDQDAGMASHAPWRSPAHRWMGKDRKSCCGNLPGELDSCRHGLTA